MKTNYIKKALRLTAALCIGVLLFTVPAYAADAGAITVNGTGAVSIAPDVAYVTLGVTTQDANPKAAQEKNNRLIAAVITAMTALGIEEKDIQTTNYYMYPNYDYTKGDNVVTGYNVNNSVTITIRDIARVGDVLDASVEAGANVSNGVQFGILNSEEAYNQALTLAIDNAEAKAKTIAAALGKSIAAPLAVTESGGMYATVYSGAMSALKAAAGEADMGVPAQAGELTVTANVQMVFEYSR